MATAAHLSETTNETVSNNQRLEVRRSLGAGEDMERERWELWDNNSDEGVRRDRRGLNSPGTGRRKEARLYSLLKNGFIQVNRRGRLIVNGDSRSANGRLQCVVNILIKILSPVQ